MGATTHIFLEHIIPDVHELCRLCLRKTEDSLPIYIDPKPEECPDVALRILICVGIEVSIDDCLPKKLCKQCYKEIEKCYTFRKKCLAADKKLQLHADAVRENKKLLENHNILKSNKDKLKEDTLKHYYEEDNPLLYVSKDTKIVKTYTNKKNNGNLLNPLKEEVPENKPKIEPEVVEPSFEAFLKTVLQQLGVVETKDDKMILQNHNVKTLEIETRSGKVLVELTEEDDPDIVNDTITINSVSNSLNDSIQTSNEQTDIKLQTTNDSIIKAIQDTNVNGAVEGEGAAAAGGVRCETCGKRLASRGALRRHARAHAGERPHACRVCRRTFAQRSVMLRHELVHKEQRPHACGVCDKSFTQEAALAAHARAHEEPRRRALSLRPCPHCNKIFLYASGLSRHLRVHSGRAFACGFCLRPFCDKSSLLRHVRAAACKHAHSTQ